MTGSFWWDTLADIGAPLLAWLTVIVVLLIARPGGNLLHEALRVLETENNAAARQNL